MQNPKPKSHILQLTVRHMPCKKASQISCRLSQAAYRLPSRQCGKYIWILAPCLSHYHSSSLLFQNTARGPSSGWLFFYSMAAFQMSSSEFRQWVLQHMDCGCLPVTSAQFTGAKIVMNLSAFRQIDYRGSLRLNNEVRLGFVDNICRSLPENWDVTFQRHHSLFLLPKEGTYRWVIQSTDLTSKYYLKTLR